MTETKLVQHGIKGTPFTFTEAEYLEDGNIHLPHTPTHHLYGSKRPLGEGDLELRFSRIVLQDLVEFSLLSLGMPKTFESLQKFSKFIFALKQNKFNDKNMGFKVDANKIAIRLRLQQEAVVDLTTPGVAGYFDFSKASICYHRKWLNLLIGDRSGMNSEFPRRGTSGKTMYTISDHNGLSAYKGLKTFTLHGSKTYMSFACMLMYMLIKQTHKPKYLRLHNPNDSLRCSHCGPVCAQNTVHMYSSMISKKQIATNHSYKRGFLYDCITEYNTNASFAGNSNDGSGESDEVAAAQAAAAGSGGMGMKKQLSKEVATSFLSAAETTLAKFPMFKFDKNKSELKWIQQFFQKIKAVATYIDEERHGVKLRMRHDKQTKLEMDFKEVIRPIITYMGTMYMGFRRVAIYKHLVLMTMMFDKAIKVNEFDHFRCIISGVSHGVYYQEMFIGAQSVECDRLALDAGIDVVSNMFSVTGQPESSMCRISAIGLKSSMKLKCPASYMDGAGGGGTTMNAAGAGGGGGEMLMDSTAAGMMGLNFGRTAGGNFSVLIPEAIKNLIELKLFKSVYASLQKHSGLTEDQKKKRLSPAARRQKLDNFLDDNGAIAAALSHIDFVHFLVADWNEFLDLFITHYMLNKYGYNPVEFDNRSGGGGGSIKKKKAGIHKLLQMVEMTSTPEEGEIKFQSKFINKDFYNSQMLAVSTRICAGMFHSDKSKNNIFQFKIGETNSMGYSALLDKGAFTTTPHTAFCTVVRGPYVSNREFSLAQLFSDIKGMNTPEDQIKLINGNVQHLITAIASVCGYGEDEEKDVTWDIAREEVQNIDFNFGLLENELIEEAFMNVFDQFKSNPDGYRKDYAKILAQAEKESSDIVYIDHEAEEDDDDDDDDSDSDSDNEEEQDSAAAAAAAFSFCFCFCFCFFLFFLAASSSDESESDESDSEEEEEEDSKSSCCCCCCCSSPSATITISSAPSPLVVVGTAAGAAGGGGGEAERR